MSPCSILDVTKSSVQNWLCFVLFGDFRFLFFWVTNNQSQSQACVFVSMLLSWIVMFLFLCCFRIRFSHANNPRVLSITGLVRQWCGLYDDYPRLFPVFFSGAIFFPCLCTQTPQTVSYQQLLVPESHKFVVPFPQKWNSGFFKVYSIKAFLLYFVNTFL